MATPSKVYLTVNDLGTVKNKPQTAEAAAKASELLQENHEKHHVYFNDSGFHNHIVHHILTLYGLGASASVLAKRYAKDASYQRPMMTDGGKPVEELRSPETFLKCMGDEKYYYSFLIFFQKEMEEKGWENVLNEYLFARNERAEAILGNMYSGFLHPMIHLGFGVEFRQPAIIAEALAQASVHDKWTAEFLLAAEKAAKTHPPSSPKTLPEILDSIHGDTKLSTAARWTDANKIRDGILVRAKDEMINHATQWVVTAENLEQKTAEMINSAIYYAAAAQRPPKQVKFDFYFMHCVNSSIFFPVFNAMSFVSTEHKVRLLQLKGYIDVTMYASRRSPPLLPEEISTYVPVKKEKGEAEWPGIFDRLFEFQDDGHAVKLGRAVKNGELLSKKWEDRNEEEVKVRGLMWEKIGNMVIDSVEDTGETWARSVGFDEAWADYEDRPRKSQI